MSDIGKYEITESCNIIDQPTAIIKQCKMGNECCVIKEFKNKHENTYIDTIEEYEVPLSYIIESLCLNSINNDYVNKVICNGYDSNTNSHIIICKKASANLYFLNKRLVEVGNFINDNNYWKHYYYFIKQCLYKITLGLKSIHYNRILHLDIKGDNILIYTDIEFIFDNDVHIDKYIEFFNKDHEIKIIDFGISKILVNPDKNNNNLAYCAQYRSIEILLKQPFNYSSDIWALGCMFYSLLHENGFLFGSARTNDSKYKLIMVDIFSKLGLPKYTYEHYNKCKPYFRYAMFDKKFMNNMLSKFANCIDISEITNFKLLIKSIMVYDSKERLNIDEIIDHPYFNSNAILLGKNINTLTCYEYMILKYKNFICENSTKHTERKLLLLYMTKNFRNADNYVEYISAAFMLIDNYDINSDMLNTLFNLIVKIYGNNLSNVLLISCLEYEKYIINLCFNDTIIPSPQILLEEQLSNICKLIFLEVDLLKKIRIFASYLMIYFQFTNIIYEYDINKIINVCIYASFKYFNVDIHKSLIDIINIDVNKLFMSMYEIKNIEIFDMIFNQQFNKSSLLLMIEQFLEK